MRGGGSEDRGRVLWDATSRGLCVRVGPPRTNVRVAWANCDSERQAREDRDERAGGATVLQPLTKTKVDVEIDPQCCRFRRRVITSPTTETGEQPSLVRLE